MSSAGEIAQEVRQRIVTSRRVRLLLQKHERRPLQAYISLLTGNVRFRRRQGQPPLIANRPPLSALVLDGIEFDGSHMGYKVMT